MIQIHSEHTEPLNPASMCNCKNITPQSAECYAQQIVVDIPDHMGEYKQRRLEAGLSSTICIDPCIIEEIQALWRLGITTFGCCCGHNLSNPMVNVSDQDIERMLELGYLQEHHDPSRKDTFRLKSVDQISPNPLPGVIYSLPT